MCQVFQQPTWKCKHKTKWLLRVQHLFDTSFKFNCVYSFDEFMAYYLDILNCNSKILSSLMPKCKMINL